MFLEKLDKENLPQHIAILWTGMEDGKKKGEIQSIWYVRVKTKKNTVAARLNGYQISNIMKFSTETGTILIRG